MLKKLLASVGIGAAKVDTRLDKDLLTPGQAFRADIVVTGGDVEQEISGLEMALITRVEVETKEGEHHENHVLQAWRISESFSIAPGGERVIPFEGVLHPETPITEVPCRYNKARVWIQTGLSIDMALDAGDRDFLRITPTPAMAAFLSAMEECSFRLYQTDVEKGFLKARDFQSRSGCYQELEFRPTGRGRLTGNEVEVSFVPERDRTYVMLEADRTFRRDKITTLTIDHNNLDVRALTERISMALG